MSHEVYTDSEQGDEVVVSEATRNIIIEALNGGVREEVLIHHYGDSVVRVALSNDVYGDLRLDDERGPNAT